MKPDTAREAEDIYNALGQEDRGRVDVAVSQFENDHLREARKDDLGYEENGHKMWAFRWGRVWIAFIEEPRLSIVHFSILSAFRYQDE